VKPAQNRQKYCNEINPLLSKPRWHETRVVIIGCCPKPKFEKACSEYRREYRFSASYSEIECLYIVLGKPLNLENLKVWQ
jgi:hypothetical protein